MATKAEQLLALVEKSPAAVAVHDKAAWMAIFAHYHVVEDPVGSKPHVGGLYDGKSGSRGTGALSRFFDTFIAPNQIQFEVKQDIVCDNHVVRDVSIHIQMSDAVSLCVPAYLLYEAVHEDNTWKVARLAAHWELLPMLKQLAAKGSACLQVGAGLSWRMLKYQGLLGTAGFTKAICSVGNRAKQAVEQFAKALEIGQLAELMQVFDNDLPCVQWPYGEKAYCPSQLIEAIEGKLILLDKCIAAGDLVVVDASWQKAGQAQNGVLFFEINRKSGKISALRAYF